MICLCLFLVLWPGRTVHHYPGLHNVATEYLLPCVETAVQCVVLIWSNYVLWWPWQTTFHDVLGSWLTQPLISHALHGLTTFKAGLWATRCVVFVFPNSTHVHSTRLLVSASNWTSFLTFASNHKGCAMLVFGNCKHMQYEGSWALLPPSAPPV
jgi:hypothetical protein